MSKKTRMSSQERVEIIANTIMSAQGKATKFDPMGNNQIKYINAPSPLVYYFMVTHDMDRETAEKIANIC